MLFILSLLLTSQAWAVDVQCTNFEFISQGRLPHNVSLSCSSGGQTERQSGYVNRTIVPSTVSFRMPDGSEKTLTNPRCDGTPCTLEMIRNYRQFTSLANLLQINPNHSYEVTGLTLSNAENIDRYTDWSTTTKQGKMGTVVAAPVDRSARESHMGATSNAAPAPADDLAAAPVDRSARAAHMDVASNPVLAPVAPAGTGGIILYSEDGESAPMLAANCKYRDRVVDGKDAAPNIVSIPGCAQKICLAEARCDVGGRRRLVNVFCPAIGTENCPDATACANSDELGATLEALQVRDLAPGAQSPSAGRR